MNDTRPPTAKRVAFVSTRIAGTDGVSLEIAKWAEVIEDFGVPCYYVAGEVDRPPERAAVIPEMHFEHPEVAEISRRAFDVEVRDAALTNAATRLSLHIRDRLGRAFDELGIEAIIVENALTIPMNLPLGMALVGLIQERGIPCVAHHHDFRWERDRFAINAVDDVLRYAFPPALPQIHHVVINSVAAEEFSRRTGLSCRIIPNVMDFENPPPPPDEDVVREFREAVGLRDGELLVLQPTRVVARKGIEHSIELIRRLKRPARLVITHASGDEGDDYAVRIREFAELLDVEVVFVDHLVGENGGSSEDGPRFTVGDVYDAADLVAYPSEYEGFGNAFLEAIHHRKPVVCNRYLVYRTDIEPCGFRTILFDGYLVNATIEEVHRVLDDDELRAEMAEHNYEVGRSYFGYDVVRDELELMIRRPHNLYRSLRRVRRADPAP